MATDWTEVSKLFDEQDSVGAMGKRREATKGCIIDYETNEKLEFPFNPEEITDEKQVAFGFMNIAGRSNPLIQWNSGGKRTISFTLSFYKRNDAEDVAKKISFIQSLQYPEYGEDGMLKKANHRILFLFGEMFTGKNKWIVEKAKVHYNNLWSPDLEPLYAEVAMSLTEWSEDAVDYKKIRG